MTSGISEQPSSLAQDWHKLSPLLDELLSREEPARGELLAELAGSEPALAAQLQDLLKEHELLQREHFLADNLGAVLNEEVVAGQTLGAYTLDKPLGQGGMGTVWLAHRSDGRFEGVAAVKLLHASLARQPISEHFIAEGNVLAQLQHPNIAHLIDAGIAPNGQPYLVLQYVEGFRIDRYCETQQLALEDRIGLFLQVLAAVTHAHAHLVVHCDIKPSNIFVTAEGQVMLLDFGIATLLAADGQLATTGDASVSKSGLTPQYAAPEQLRGEPVTTATDVYTLGLVLYLLIAGRHAMQQPEIETSERATTSRSARLASPSLSDLQAPGSRLLCDDIDAIVAKALRKLPHERYLSVNAFADDLRRALAEQPVAARIPTLGYRTRKFWRRNRGGVLSAALTSLVLIIATAFALQQMVEARRQRDIAQEQLQRAEGFTTVITNLLAQAGPGGAALSAEQLLDRAVVVMEREYANDPETLVSMLMRISGRYMDLLNTQKEYDTLLKAEAIARNQRNPLMLLEADCNTIETEVALGRMAAAESRWREAQSLLDTQRMVDDGVRSDCLHNAAVLERASGRPTQALDYVKQGLRVLEQAGRTTGNRYSSLLSMMAAFNDNQVEAHADWLKLVELDEHYGRSDAVAGVRARTSVANSLLNLGQVRAALDMLEATEPSLTATPIGKPSTVVALLRYGQVMTRLGDYRRAREALTAALASNEGRGNRSFETDVRVALADALIGGGELNSAQQQLSRIRTLLEAQHTKNLRWLTAAERLAAAMDFAQNELPAAQRELDEAVARVAAIEDKENPYLGGLLLIKSRLAIAQGDTAQALRSASRALELFRVNSLAKGENANVGEALLLKAEAHNAAGDLHSARAEARRAYAILRNSLSERHALSLAAHKLAQGLHSGA